MGNAVALTGMLTADGNARRLTVEGVRCFRCRALIVGEPMVVAVLGPVRTVAAYCDGCANAAPRR